MDFKKIERKWQDIWEKEKLSNFNYKNTDKKYYALEMFSYPSAAKLHLGHWYNYGPTDSFVRYKKMKGFEVFQPMGFDTFGLPAENYAIKTGIHPKDSTEKNIENMKSSAYVLIFDINKFKQINDTYGHVEGDRCLTLVAQKIYAVYGKYGSCYRIGGDEFCVIMYRQLNRIDELNNKFKHALEQLRKGVGSFFGVSVGYAYYDEKKADIQAVIEEADEMMYQNKHENI